MFKSTVAIVILFVCVLLAVAIQVVKPSQFRTRSGPLPTSAEGREAERLRMKAENNVLSKFHLKGGLKTTEYPYEDFIEEGADKLEEFFTVEN